MESTQNTPSHFKHQHHPLTGILLVLAGAVLLAGNLGFIPQPLWNIIFQWPSVFAVIAIINLASRKYTPAMIFAALWVFFVLPDILPDIRTDEIWKFWPVLLILIGLLFLRSHKKRNFKKLRNPGKTRSDNLIEEVVIFSGNIKRIESDNFLGGEITSIFGGTELYFNNSKIAPEGAEIELVNIFGGTKLIVPRDWNIKIEVVSILGGFADKRVYMPGENTSNQTLKIKGVTIFGGGELTNY
ncbi:MAG: LiaF-related protein [Marinilabilia sp.]